LITSNHLSESSGRDKRKQRQAMHANAATHPGSGIYEDPPFFALKTLFVVAGTTGGCNQA